VYDLICHRRVVGRSRRRWSGGLRTLPAEHRTSRSRIAQQSAIPIRRRAASRRSWRAADRTARAGCRGQDADRATTRSTSAPPDYHLLVERGSFALSVDEKDSSFGGPLDRRAVRFGRRRVRHRAVIGIILTGANDDGAHGPWRGSRKSGGVALVQESRRARPGGRCQTLAIAVTRGRCDPGRSRRSASSSTGSA